MMSSYDFRVDRRNFYLFAPGVTQGNEDAGLSLRFHLFVFVFGINQGN